MPLDDPADVAGCGGRSSQGARRARGVAEQRLDRAIASQQAPLLAFGQGGEQGDDVGLALAVERREGAPPGGAEGQVEMARVDALSARCVMSLRSFRARSRRLR